MEKIKNNYPYILLIINFYLIPLFIRDTGSAMFIMLIIIPLICLIISAIYGYKKGFNVSYILAVALIFIPSIFIFYNSSAYIYILIYSIIALVGLLIGMLIYKSKL